MQLSGSILDVSVLDNHGEFEPRYTVVIGEHWVFLMSENPMRKGIYGVDKFAGEISEINFARSGSVIQSDEVPSRVRCAITKRLMEIISGAIGEPDVFFWPEVCNREKKNHDKC